MMISRKRAIDDFGAQRANDLGDHACDCVLVQRDRTVGKAQEAMIKPKEPSGAFRFALSANIGSWRVQLWSYEGLRRFPRNGEVTMWSIGAQQAGGWTWVPTTYQTQLREGNWDWVTQSQLWHGIGGAVGSGTQQTIPDSLYLTPKPVFFGSNPWLWVNPSNGTVATLPAKACLEQGKMPTCMQGDTTTAPTESQRD